MNKLVRLADSGRIPDILMRQGIRFATSTGNAYGLKAVVVWKRS